MTEPHRPATGSNPTTGGTGIIRREPTGAIPVSTGTFSQPVPRATGAQPVSGYGLGTPAAPPDELPPVPVAAATAAILSGWATSVVATDLIAGWWGSDRLFCVAVAFLTLVFAVTTVSGVIMVLRQRSPGHYLIAIGAAVALLTFGSLFIAGARVPWIVHTIPVLQIASAVLALHPVTKRWLEN